MRYALKLRILAAILLCISTSWATTFIMKSEDDKIREAELICSVEVLNVHSEVLDASNKKNSGRITLPMTRAQVKPLECFKGSVSSNFYVSWPGGTGQTQDRSGKTVSSRTFVPGTPNLKPGQKAVLFLNRSSPSADFTVHSWINGVIDLKCDAANRECEILRRSQSASAPQPHGSMPQVVETVAPTLKSFREKVQRLTQSKP